MDMGCEFELAQFDAPETEDRPLAPDEEDYPVGCEVELVDVDTARIAQSEEFWDPILEKLFRKPKARVTVLRHSGDFSFVMCDTFDSETKFGCSLYRACLKEPKVKFKRYIPNLSVLPPDEEAGNIGSPEGQQPASDDMEDFMPAGSDEAPALRVPTSARCDTSVTIGDSTAQQLVRRGNRALLERNYADAVRLYTEALEMGRADAAHILANRSAAHLCMKNTEQALQDAKMSIRICQSHIGYTRAGNVLRLLKRFDEAKVCYDRALQLKPGNKDLEFNQALNTFANIFRTRAEHMPVTITLLPSMHPVIAAQKNMTEQDVAWTESATIAILVHAHRSGATGGCMQCGRSLIRAANIASQVMALNNTDLSSLFRETHIFRETHVVECHERCGDLYCSEQCRTRAWAEHHWIECCARGRWGSAIQRCHALCAEREKSGTPLDEVLLVRLAFRMLAKINSSGKELADAVGMFTWLNEGPPLTATEQHVVEGLLRPCHSILQEAFSREEHALFDFALLLRCFRQVRQNCVAITTSPWQSLLHRAESHTALLNLRQERSHRGLDAIRHLDPAVITGLAFPCMALFDVYSIAMNTPLPPGGVPAVTMRDITESLNSVAVIAQRNIKKKEIITGMR
jgi:tetratricopeptide (TPR) repeat protein